MKVMRIIISLAFGIGSVLFLVAAIFGVYFQVTEVTFISLSLFCLMVSIYVWMPAIRLKVQCLFATLAISFLGFGILNYFFKWG